MATAAATPKAPSSAAPVTTTSSALSSSRQRALQNGVARRPQNDTKTPTTPAGVTSSDKHANDMLLFLMAGMVGNIAEVTVMSGDRFSGVFSSSVKDASEPLKYVLKMAKRLSEQTNGHVEDSDEYIGFGEDHTLVIESRDVVHISVPGVQMDKVQAKLSNGNSAGFKTDTDISGNLDLRERELQRWEPSSELTSNTNLSFNTSASNGTWDQFKVNERLFGTKTDYDENMYTTTINRDAPDFKRRAAEADRKAREIEAGGSHEVKETDNDRTEEEKFSGVTRDMAPLAPGQTIKYTPPARRAPTGQATIPGVPVDPAIVSAQLARPGSNAKPFVTASTEQSVGKETVEAQQQPQLPTDPISVNPPFILEKVPSPLPGPIPTSRVPGRSSIASPKPIPNTTANVEREVLKDFQAFAQREKRDVVERQRMSKEKEREVKLNDLKSFSTNFKLKTAVPQDILGILAKDKSKQVEIIEKSQRALEITTSKAVPLLPVEAPRLVVSPSDEGQQPTPSVGADKNVKNGRISQPAPPLQNGKADRSTQPLPPKAGAGNLGQRLMSQPQYRDRNTQMPKPIQEPPSRNGSTSQITSPGATRLNVQAPTFKPNPTAVTFSPTGERPSTGSTSPLRTRTQSSSRPVNRVSFFGENKPKVSELEKKSIRDAFNPITRMKKEAEATGRVKDYANNGGIPQAYRTLPTWDVVEENREKSYVDMFDPPALPPSLSPANLPMAYQQQLPPHLQQPPHGTPQSIPHQPAQAYPTHHQGRDHRFDDHRMQYSNSQSSHYASPRLHQTIPYVSPMIGQMQPQFGQPMAFPYGVPGQPLRQGQFPAGAQFIQQQGGPMIMNQPGAIGYSVQGQMFSPGQAQVYPSHLMGPQTPNAQSGFSNSRGAPMMMPQGSQQGHLPQQQFFMNAMQHGGQPYPQQHQAPYMRGGFQMSNQPSFGGNNHYPQQYQNNQRGYSQLGVNFGQQTPAMDRGMSQQRQAPALPMNTGNGQDEVK